MLQLFPAMLKRMQNSARIEKRLVLILLLVIVVFATLARIGLDTKKNCTVFQYYFEYGLTNWQD